MSKASGGHHREDRGWPENCVMSLLQAESPVFSQATPPHTHAHQSYMRALPRLSPSWLWFPKAVAESHTNATTTTTTTSLFSSFSPAPPPPAMMTEFRGHSREGERAHQDSWATKDESHHLDLAIPLLSRYLGKKSYEFQETTTGIFIVK